VHSFDHTFSGSSRSANHGDTLSHGDHPCYRRGTERRSSFLAAAQAD
jgi:hypothetical protein